jgi:hypothetical protein
MDEQRAAVSDEATQPDTPARGWADDEPLTFRCRGCGTNWDEGSIDQAQPDGHYCCPICENDPRLDVVPVAAQRAIHAHAVATLTAAASPAPADPLAALRAMPRDARWDAWVTDADDLLKRAIDQHSDMGCGCGMTETGDDCCYVGWLLELLSPGSVADPVALSPHPTQGTGDAGEMIDGRLHAPQADGTCSGCNAVMGEFLDSFAARHPAAVRAATEEPGRCDHPIHDEVGESPWPRNCPKCGGLIS